MELSFIKFLDDLDESDKNKKLDGNKRLRNGELNYVDEEGQGLTVLCDLEPGGMFQLTFRLLHHLIVI